MRFGSSVGGLGILGTDSNHDLDIRTNSSSKMRITSGGSVGIGTSSPTTKLDVLSVGADAINIGAGNDFSGLRLTSDAGTWAIRTSTADALFFYDVSSGAERMRITSGGNVGIGTTSPGSKLSAQSAASVFSKFKKSS